MQTLPDLIAEYNPKNVYNIDESDRFFRVISDKFYVIEKLHRR